MDIWNQLFSNKVLLTAAVGWFVAQTLKTILYLAINREWNWERMWGAGGMPSAHSSMVCALTVSIARISGVDSPLFAMAVMFAFVTVYDAMGVRRETGNHARLLNQYLNALFEKRQHGNEWEPINLKELVGHTPIEVGGGIIIGLLTGFLMPM